MFQEDQPAQQPQQEPEQQSEPTPPPQAPSPNPGQSSPHVEGFKAAIMDAIEILKLNKNKMREVMESPGATMYAWIFLLAPAIINTLILVTWLGRWGFRWHAPMVILQPIGIIVFVYAMHFTAVKLFKGKGELKKFFRAYGYANAVQLLNIPFTLLWMLGVYAIASLSSLVILAAAIIALIVTYNAMKENYQLSAENTIFSFIIAIIITAVVNMVLTSMLLPILFPAPAPVHQAQEALEQMGDFFKGLSGSQ